jgi:hypothetical protein
MSVTKKDIQSRFGGEVSQVGHKQLFVALFPAYQLLISYLTIVGYCFEGTWLLTTKKYSHTTSKQLSQFSYRKTVVWIDEVHLEELIEAARGN